MAEPDERRGPGRAGAGRSAAVQAFPSPARQAGITRERAQDLADELAQAAGRLIGAFDELRPATADDVRSLREQVAALEQRGAALAATAAQPKAKPKPKAKKAS